MQKLHNKREERRFEIMQQLNAVARDVLETLPLPFGSFEKAKYIIYISQYFPLYFFTTTIHNTEECIEIMKFKFYSMQSSLKYCRVYKIQNGVKKLIYDNKPIDKP